MCTARVATCGLTVGRCPLLHLLSSVMGPAMARLLDITEGMPVKYNESQLYSVQHTCAKPHAKSLKSYA